MNCLNCGSPEWVRSAPTGGIEHVVFECGDSASIFPDGQALKSPSAGVDPNGPACRMIRALRVSQLKRMLECAESRAWAMENACPEDAEWAAKHRPKMVRLASACHRELDRLRAQQ